MLREGSKVTVTIQTFNKSYHCPGVFTVQKAVTGELGIDYNEFRRPSTFGGELVVPFSGFASSVTFEDVKTGKQYFYSPMWNRLCLIK